MVLRKINSLNYSKEDIDNSLKAFKERLEFLALSYKEQIKKTSLPENWIPCDIIEDWDIDYITSILTPLVKYSVVNSDVEKLVDKVIDNFSKYSYGASEYNEVIWTSEAMENHSFWESQRMLAKEILNLINIE